MDTLLGGQRAGKGTTASESQLQGGTAIYRRPDSEIERGAKTVTMKTAGGTEHVFRLTDHAAEDAGRDISEGAEKSGKVTVYYTERAGHQVAHLFSKTL
jgi:hypothetical protein